MLWIKYTIKDDDQERINLIRVPDPDTFDVVLKYAQAPVEDQEIVIIAGDREIENVAPKPGTTPSGTLEYMSRALNQHVVVLDLVAPIKNMPDNGKNIVRKINISGR